MAYYDNACRAVAKAKNVDEVKAIRSKAAAMRAYSKVAKNKSLEIDACEIRIRAEIKLGDMLNAQKKTIGLNEGGRPAKTPAKLVGVSRATLAEADIDYKLSARAQKLAATPEREREIILKGWRDRIEVEQEWVTTDLLGAH